MRPFLRQLWQLLRGPSDPVTTRASEKRRARLELVLLEDRLVPAPLTLGTVSGTVQVLDGQPSTLLAPGIQVQLTGTSDQGANVNLTTTTDAGGSFVFRSVDEGDYQLSALGGGSAGVSVAGGQDTTLDLGVGGFAPTSFSMRQLCTGAADPTSPDLPSADLPFAPAGDTANSAPTVRQALANITLASGTSNTFNAAAGYADPDTTNSQLLFDTNNGNLRLNLFDSQAPQTVTNFLDYVVTSRFDNTIFHRLSSLTQGGGGFNPTPKQVLQGGGFETAPFDSVANAGDPAIANEASAARPNDIGTVAMARQTAPNSATSQFFFNITDNPGLDPAGANAGFAVFGSIASDAESQATFDSLQDATSSNQTNTNGAFSNLPLNNFTGTDNDPAFPGNTTPSNFLVIEAVTVVNLDERLTYTVVSISDPTLVTITPVAGHPEVFGITAATVTQMRTATVTVQATDQFGLSVQSSFTVTVNP